jgi:hypothetical protein
MRYRRKRNKKKYQTSLFSVFVSRLCSIIDKHKYVANFVGSMMINYRISKSY